MPNYQRWKNIMKCYPFEEKRLAKWEPPYIVQPKYDGFRCRAVPLDNGYLLLSSEENIFYSVPHINEALHSWDMKIELDGELYHHGMNFDQLSSIVSRTVNLHPDHKLIQFHAFDYVSEEPQAVRIKKLGSMNLPKHFVTSPFWICENLSDIMKVFDNLIELGYEGMIVRHLEVPYERKRSLWVMKFKPKKEDEYEIIGYQEEISINGTPKGRLGSLVCKSGDGQLFNVGTGFNDKMRSALWSTKEELSGKIAKVQYQHLTSGKKVPRFPVFVEVVDNEKGEPVI